MRRCFVGPLFAVALLAQPLTAHAGASEWFHSRPDSPFRLNAALDTSLLAIAVPSYIALFFVQNGLSPPTCGQPGHLCNLDDVPAFDRWAMTFHTSLKQPADLVFHYGPWVVPVAMFLDYGPFHWKSYLVDMTIAVESMTWAGVLTSLFRFAVRRPRPYLYVDGVYPQLRGSADATMSFWSGHVADLFAISVTIGWTTTLRHGLRSPTTWLVWTGMLGVSTAIAAMRVLSGEHFLSDVLVGTAAGTGVGLLIPYVHPRRRSDGVAARVLSGLRPIAGPDMGGLAFTGTL
jgi:membrane-associated phospholipid phosphatase